MNNYSIRPPQQVRIICYGMTYSDGSDVSPNHLLEWRGSVSIRADHHKDDTWELHTGDGRTVECGLSDIEIMGRTPGCHTVQEWAKEIREGKRPMPFDTPDAPPEL